MNGGCTPETVSADQATSQTNDAHVNRRLDPQRVIRHRSAGSLSAMEALAMAEATRSGSRLYPSDTEDSAASDMDSDRAASMDRSSMAPSRSKGTFTRPRNTHLSPTATDGSEPYVVEVNLPCSVLIAA
ncbi:hypothetical protein BIW11_11234 [Tropilaelaps mercedesae]|uniref:Uncharacterized protein n=1 Tax=Tropilaelaps mercedesae TaxID=418985 RepID=A0A1V9XCA8_9ACAR|nr:hypothetical protein BIW11_11234 [Tropilaelaps mercedesae]